MKGDCWKFLSNCYLLYEFISLRDSLHYTYFVHIFVNRSVFLHQIIKTTGMINTQLCVDLRTSLFARHDDIVLTLVVLTIPLLLCRPKSVRLLLGQLLKLSREN